MDKMALVKNAMLAVQRYPWEQGTCMQAIYESGDINTAIAMAHDAVLRQQPDGRLAVINDNIAVTDPAANGEMVFRAYEIIGDTWYLDAANRMLDYLLYKAPKTDKGILCHNEISFQEGFSPNQIWADSIYMAPPFLAVMGYIEEAVKQIKGMYAYLKDESTGLVRHIYDADNAVFVRNKLWATGNGWALIGIARVIATVKDGKKEPGTDNSNDEVIVNELKEIFLSILDGMLKYQLDDGRFHDILDESDSFIDGASAMMMAAAIYRGVADGWLSTNYLSFANLVSDNIDEHIDEYGIIHEVCGCPHFVSEGTSAESMAAYIMMRAWEKRVEKGN